MNKFLALTAALLITLAAQAVPAHPGLVTISQPDGKELTVKLVGDEFFNYSCTADGYTVVRNQDGNYEYATLRAGQVVPSGLLARDQQVRSQQEQAFLAQAGKYLRSEDAVKSAKLRRAQRDQSLAPVKAKNLENYRGLVILVNLSNKTFRRTDAQAFYQAQTNNRNYTGYAEQGSGTWVKCTGSVRDYFYDNSMGKFDPQFDVVGPVNMSYSATAFQQTSGAQTIFNAVIEKVKNQVDFSNYDADNNGVVDMVYFIVAGYGSNYQGNNTNYLWPHASSFYNNYNTYNGKSLGRYACSVELDGYESYGNATIGGIGTMCHEFSHVLGVMDHYDTDYGGSGGESNHPGEWDVMAGGSYFNSGRTPCGYTLFERYTMGFANPTVITEPGDYTLNPVNTSNEGYIIKSPVAREYFILDNRQKTRWDAEIPGHGMLVWRVDSTSPGVWASNDVNVDPNHNYLEIIRAGKANTSSASDPFPGTRNSTALDANTSPALVTWNKYATGLGLYDIKESNGVITFRVEDGGDTKSVVEDFEHMPVSDTGSAKDVMGNFVNWSFVKTNVVYAPDSACNGRKAVAMVKPSNFYMTQELPALPFLMSYHVYNYSGTTAKVRVECKDINASSWTDIYTAEVASGTDELVSCPVVVANKKVFRLSQPLGSSTAPIYVDDITFYYKGDDVPLNEFTDVLGDVNGDGEVDVTDVNFIINIVLGKNQSVDTADVNGDGKIDVTDVNNVINIILGKS